MTPEILMCAAILTLPIDGPRHHLRFQPPMEIVEKCDVGYGCYILNQEQLIGGLRAAHQAGKRSVTGAEIRRGYDDGQAAFQAKQKAREMARPEGVQKP